jgi:hypothetical protein
LVAVLVGLLSLCDGVVKRSLRDGHTWWQRSFVLGVGFVFYSCGPDSYSFDVFFISFIIVRPNPCGVLWELPSGEVNRLDTYPPGRLLLNRDVSNALGLKYHEQASFNVAFAELDIYPRVAVSNCVLHRIQH